MTARTYGLLNLCRDKKPGTTERIDRAALVKLRDALGGPDATRAVAFLVEINEGDDNNELALAKEVFKGWRCFGERTHEPIFVTHDIAAEAMASVHYIKGSAVQHWSPERSVLAVEFDTGSERRGPKEVLVATHLAAGVYTAGDRPAWAREPLAASWHLTNAKFLAVKREYHRAGHNVTSMCDLNHYSLPGLPGEVTVVHERTDYGRAWPRNDSEAAFRDRGSLPVGLDSHGIHLMSGEYRQKR